MPICKSPPLLFSIEADYSQAPIDLFDLLQPTAGQKFGRLRCGLWV